MYYYLTVYASLHRVSIPVEIIFTLNICIIPIIFILTDFPNRLLIRKTGTNLNSCVSLFLMSLTQMSWEKSLYFFHYSNLNDYNTNFYNTGISS